MHHSFKLKIPSDKYSSISISCSKSQVFPHFITFSSAPLAQINFRTILLYPSYGAIIQTASLKSHSGHITLTRGIEGSSISFASLSVLVESEFYEKITVSKWFAVNETLITDSIFEVDIFDTTSSASELKKFSFCSIWLHQVVTHTTKEHSMHLKEVNILFERYGSWIGIVIAVVLWIITIIRWLLCVVVFRVGVTFFELFKHEGF